MTIPSTPRKAGPLLGNGVTTSFPFSFKVFAPTDVKVVIADSAGVETVLVLDSDYTVTLNANQDTSPGGTVNYPISGSPLPSGSVLSIIGNIDYDQPLDLPSGGNFSPLALENQLDRTTMQIQQLREEMDRAVKLPPTSSESIEDLVDDLQRIADSADNLDTVANNIAAVNTVATNIADVQTVADNVADVTNFADVYYGPSATDPVLRNDGTARQPGDLYFNTGTKRLRVFDGAAWVDGPVNAGTINVQRFSGTGAQTDFVLSTDPVSENNTLVYINGVYQQKDQYSLHGTTLSFTSAPPLGTDNIEVLVIATLALGTVGAEMVPFKQSGTGAVDRTAQDKLREVVSVKDFGAVGDGVTDDTAAFARAEADADEIYLPDGTYSVTITPSKKYYGPGTVVVSGSTYLPVSAAQDIGLDNTVIGRGAGILISTGTLNTLVGVAAGRNITTGSRNVYLGINGGSGNTALSPVIPMTGSNNIGIGFHAVKKCQTGSFNVGIGTDAGNEITTGNGNTCLGGSAGQQLTIGSDNTLVGRSSGLRLGTDASTNPSNPASWVALSGTGNVSVGRDALRNGYDCDYNTVVGYQAMRGTKSEDDLTGNITGGRNVAIGYRAMYAGPVSVAGNTVIGSEAGMSLTAGANNVIIGNQAGRDVEGSGNIIIGNAAYRSVVSASNKFVVANQSGTAFLDGDMVGATDASNVLSVDASFRPAADNTRALGGALRRWAVVYAATGTINTSDEREKQQIRELSDSERAVAIKVKGLLKAFKWNEAVDKKGDGARIHFGVIAQEVIRAFESEGLNAFDYAVVCYDEWQDEYRPIMAEKTVEYVTPDGAIEHYTETYDTGERELVRPAGNRYGIRYDELLAFIIAAL